MATVTESDIDRGRLRRRARSSTATTRGFFVETYRREWFPSGREMIQGNRGDRQAGCIVGLHYHLHQADYWYVPFGRAPRRAARPARRARPPTAPRSRSTSARAPTARHDHRGVFIPPGVAHGFAALTDMTITYLVDGYYNPADELGVAWDDPAIGADWGVADPILSDRDQTNPAPRRPRAARCSPHYGLPDLSSMRLFVTGAAGFIGSNYVRHVLANIRRQRHRVRRAHLRRQPREPRATSRTTRATRS